MAGVWVSLGSNIEREKNIRGAVRELRQRYGPLLLSRVYESDAVGFNGDAFYNMVVGFDTDRSPAELMQEFRLIESRYGRVRGAAKFSSRTLDIDLLTYADQVLRDEITRYSFVLRPLAEVAPDEVHPLTGRTYADLWSGFDASQQPLSAVDFDFNF